MCQERGIWGPGRVETQLLLWRGASLLQSGLTCRQAACPGREETARVLGRSAGSGPAALGSQARAQELVAWGELFNLDNGQGLL